MTCTGHLHKAAADTTFVVQYFKMAVVNSRRLRRFQTTDHADIVIMIHKELAVASVIARLQQDGIIIKPVDIVEAHGDLTWHLSLTKLRVFELEEYERIIYLDADGLVMKNLDHLFALPSISQIATPRAYWLKQPYLNSAFLVLTPNKAIMGLLVQTALQQGTFDMDALTYVYNHTSLVLPNHYAVLSKDFRTAGSSNPDFYGGLPTAWHARDVYEQAFYIHVSEWPLPKPWLPDFDKYIDESSSSYPACPSSGCVGRDIWARFHHMFLDELQDLDSYVNSS